MESGENPEQTGYCNVEQTSNATEREGEGSYEAKSEYMLKYLV